MSRFEVFLFAFALGYVIADARRPRTIPELRTQLQREEGVPATESSDTAGRTGD